MLRNYIHKVKRKKYFPRFMFNFELCRWENYISNSWNASDGRTDDPGAGGDDDGGTRRFRQMAHLYLAHSHIYGSEIAKSNEYLK